MQPDSGFAETTALRARWLLDLVAIPNLSLEEEARADG